MQRGLPAEGAEAAGGIRDADACRALHHPTAEPLQEALDGGELLQGRHPAVAHDDVGLAAHDRRDQPRDVLTTILVICVRVDNDIRAGRNSRFQSGLERSGQPAVARVADDVVDAQAPRDFDGFVPAAVVNDEYSMTSIPGSVRGKSATVNGKVASSL
jgi:hypothetical protein